jgi:hypothetical protein
VGNKWKDKRGFLVIRFSFLVGIASVVSLLRNDRKKKNTENNTWAINTVISDE